SAFAVAELRSVSQARHRDACATLSVRWRSVFLGQSNGVLRQDRQSAPIVLRPIPPRRSGRRGEYKEQRRSDRLLRRPIFNRMPDELFCSELTGECKYLGSEVLGLGPQAIPIKVLLPEYSVRTRDRLRQIR